MTRPNDSGDSQDEQPPTLTPGEPIIQEPLLWTPVAVMVWLATLGMLTAATLRIAAHDATVHLVWINSFTLYVYLPAYAALIYAWMVGRKLLAFLAGAVIVCHVVWVLPDYLPAARVSEEMSTAPRLRIFSANLLYNNHQYAALLEEIQSHDPDVVLLLEYSDAWRGAIVNSPVLSAYPHRLDNTRTDAFGIAMFSKTPLESQQLFYIDGLPVVRASVRLGENLVQIFGVHPTPPRSESNLARSNRFWAGLTPELEQAAEPLVVIGDFNATQHALSYARLRGLGLEDAHEMSGRGYAVTWPNGKSGIPPVRIDHALISPSLVCLNTEEAIGAGSDHKPIIVDLALPAIQARSASE